MSFFSIETEKCNQDRHCLAVCPGNFIKWDDQRNLPAPIEEIDAYCIRCGHCVAVCPTQALSLVEMAADECQTIDPDLIPTAEQTAHLLKSRRSIRVYRKKAVPQEMLTELIDVARYAPSGHNYQPVHWQVESDPERLRQLCGLVVDWMRHMVKTEPQFALAMGMDRVVTAWEKSIDRIIRSAPHVIIAHGDKADTSAETACTIALTYLEIAAFSQGLGACWAGYFKRAANLWEPMQKMLALPENHMVCGAMLVGYPRYSYHRIPLRRPMAVTWR